MHLDLNADLGWCEGDQTPWRLTGSCPDLLRPRPRLERRSGDESRCGDQQVLGRDPPPLRSWRASNDPYADGKRSSGYSTRSPWHS
jgi:hypothetical protein